MLVPSYYLKGTLSCLQIETVLKVMQPCQFVILILHLVYNMVVYQEVQSSLQKHPALQMLAAILFLLKYY